MSALRMKMLSVSSMSSVLSTIAAIVVTAALGASVQAQSLYNENSFRPLVADNKAYKLGDILTVQVFENSSASTSSDTGTRRKNSISADVSRDGIHLKQLGATFNGDFDGGGRTQRVNRVLAILSVTVKEILPNNDLIISGEQSLTVNDEVQKVNIQGRVRPVDISDGNVILSTRIAEAKITFIGEGDLTERQRRGWWRKALDWLGL